MQSHIVLISNDNDFFEYILQKLSLRVSDEVFRFSFSDLTDKFHLLNDALMIVNAQNNLSETLELLGIYNHTPIIVFTYTLDNQFKINALKNGAFGYVTFDTTDEEFDAVITSALNYISSLEKNNTYREILVKNNIICKNNEVYIDYNSILDIELDKIKANSQRAVLVAIAPNEKTKFLLKANQIETIIINNIRENDILMNYAPNKYFLLLHNTDINSAKEIWNKIRSKINENIYAGFASTGLKNRQQLINEALNKLHEEINRNLIDMSENSSSGILTANFKLYRHDFKKKVEKIVTPAFYHIQQKYANKLYGTSIKVGFGDGYANITINSKHQEGLLKITSPGFSKINIDISLTDSKSKFPKTKRIMLEPEELEEGLLEDLLEQFITEFRNEEDNELVK